MTNQDKAEQIILGRTATSAAKTLKEAGLLMPDLPEPNADKIFVPEGRGWELEPTGHKNPIVWTAPGGLIMLQRVDPGAILPEQARTLASYLLAAADYAESGIPDD